MDGSSTRARPRHPLFERFYAWVSPRMEEGGLGERRRELLGGISGRVIEIGAGNGLNFAHYPPDVSEVVAVEPAPYLRDIARANARRATVPVEVVDGVAERLPVADASFDAAVISLVLCSVSEPQAALLEIRRVLRPGGVVHFLEHVRAEAGPLRSVQRVLDATVWPVLGGGCHTGRDTASAIAEAGFELERLRRFRWPDSGFPTPTSPHIVGVARRPEEGAKKPIGNRG